MLKVDDPPIGKLFSMIARSYVGNFTNRLKDLPLDRYFYPLVLIDEADGPITQKDLSERMLTDKVSILRMVDHLEEKGLLLRERNPQDKRSFHLHLTDEGKALLPRVKESIKEANKVALKGFSEEEVEALEEQLSRILCNLSNEPRDDVRIHFSKAADDDA